MSRTRLSIFALGAGLIVAALFGDRLRSLRDAREAAGLVAQAQTLLGASVEDTPVLSELRATDARKLCDEALALSANPRTRGLVELSRAIEALGRGDLTHAHAAATRAAPVLSDVALLGVVRAEIARQQHDLAGARAQLAHTLATTPRDARVLLLASDVARENGSGDEALSFAERGLVLQPRAAALYERRGLARELLGDLPGARADLERASRLDQRSASALLHLGRVLHRVGDLRASLLAFSASASRDAHDADVWIGSGVCRRELGDLVGARADFEDALARDPEHAEPQLALGDLDLAEGNLPSALTRYRRAVELDKQNAAAWVKLGNALVRSNTFDQAQLAFRTAITLDGELAQAHNGLGAALLAQSQLPAAEIELGVAINLAPRDPNPWRMLALLRKKAGDLAGSESAQTEAEARSEHADPLAIATLTGSSLRAAPASAPAQGTASRTGSAARRP